MNDAADMIRVADQYNIKAITHPEAIVELATYYQSLGITEIGGDNCGPWMTWMDCPQGSPWCGYFAQKVYRTVWAALGEHPTIDWSPPPDPSYYVPTMVERAKEANLFKLSSAGYVPKPGDVAFLKSGGSWSHVAIVIGQQADKVVTIDGNWSDGCVFVERYVSECDYGSI
jgi:hypothetical protein